MVPAGTFGLRLRLMDWTTPVSTPIGALVGVGSTLLSEGVRARRDRGNQSHRLRRQLYARMTRTGRGTPPPWGRGVEGPPEKT